MSILHHTYSDNECQAWVNILQNGMIIENKYHSYSIKTAFFLPKFRKNIHPWCQDTQKEKKKKETLDDYFSLIPESNTFVLWEISLPSNQISSASASQNWLEKEVKLMSYRDENEYYQEVWIRIKKSDLYCHHENHDCFLATDWSILTDGWDIDQSKALLHPPGGGWLHLPHLLHRHQVPPCHHPRPLLPHHPLPHDLHWSQLHILRGHIHYLALSRHVQSSLF